METKTARGSFSNEMVARILTSPLHGMLSSDVMLVTVTGRKSGQRITLPVNYWQQNKMVLVTSRKERTWWRNLRRGAHVAMEIRGKTVLGWATVIEDPAQMQAVLAQVVHDHGKLPGTLRVLERELPERVLVQIKVANSQV